MRLSGLRVPAGRAMQETVTDGEPKRFQNPLMGLLKDSALSIDHFLAEKQREKEKEHRAGDRAGN